MVLMVLIAAGYNLCAAVVFCALIQQAHVVRQYIYTNIKNHA
jgi:hypothetical protein